MFEDIIPFLSVNGKLFNTLYTGKSYCDDSYHKIRPSSHVYSFEYIVSGHGRLICDNELIYTQAGDAYILPENSNHDILSLGDQEKIWFTVNSPIVKHLLKDYNMLGTRHFKGFGDSKIFNKIFNTAKKSTGIDSQYEIAILIHKLISSFSKFEDEQRAARITSPAVKIKEYIDDNIQRRVTIKELSNLVYLSPSRVINVFKEKYGYSPCNYALITKIAEAKILLANSDISIKEIAQNLGFDDAKYFSKYFKEQVGVSPKKYRKSVGKTE